MIDTMTRINPNYKGYRVLIGRSNTIQMDTVGGCVELTGSVVDRLGEYEAICLSPDEIYNALRESGKLPKQAEEKRRQKNLYG